MVYAYNVLSYTIYLMNDIILTQTAPHMNEHGLMSLEDRLDQLPKE